MPVADDKHLILQLLILTVLLAAIELVLCGSLWAVQEMMHRAVAQSGPYWFNRAFRLGAISVMFKGIFAYYLVIIVFCYFKKISIASFSSRQLIMGTVLAFLVSFSVMTVFIYVKNGMSLSVTLQWLGEAVTFKAPLGNEMYIGLWTSLLSPFVLAVVLKVFRVSP